MTKGGFHTSFNLIEKMLKDLNLLKSKGVKLLSRDGISEDFKSVSTQGDYFKLYQVGKDNFDYDFLLTDESYFQFEYEETAKGFDVRYAFFQNPSDFVTYEEFIQEVLIPSGVTDSVEEAGAIFESEYSQYLSEQERNSRYLALRYDIDYGNYRPLIHSISHMHVGNFDNLRIPSNKSISPFRFVLFAIKNAYYNEWKEFATDNDMAVTKVLRSCCDGERALTAKEWNEMEGLDLFLK